MNRFLVIFILIPHLIFGQTSVLKNQTRHTKSFRYIKYPDANEQISNHILEKLSLPGTFYNSFFETAFDESAELLVKNNKLVFNYRLYNFLFNGNCTYRNIPVSKVLLPSEVCMTVYFYDDNKKELLSLKLDTCCLTSPLDIHEWNIFINASDSAKLIHCSSMHVISKIALNENDRQRFDNYISYIDDYYSVEKELMAIGDILKNIKIENIDLMPLYQIDLNKTAKDFEKIESKNFFIYLDLSIEDPLNFKIKYKQFKEQQTSLYTAVNHLMSSIDEVYFNKGYSYFLKNNYDKAVEYFERSVKANPLYVRSHYRLAEVYFIKGNIDKSAEIIIHIVQKLKIEKEIEENIRALAQQIMLEYVDRGRIKSVAEDFHNALIEYQKADEFCKKMPLIQCHNSIYTGIENAQTGLYKSYIVIANKAVENNKYELAAKFVYDARTYLNNNPTLKINHKETDEIIEKLLYNLVEQGRNLYQQQNYEAALNTYNKALDLCSISDNKNCQLLLDNEIKIVKTALYENILVIIRGHIENENILEAENLLIETSRFQNENKISSYAVFETENLWLSIYKIKYRNFINAGVQKLTEGSTKEALEFFLQAKDIEKKHIAFPDVNLDSNIQVSGKPLLLNILSIAKIKAWANDLEMAKQLKDTIRVKMELYLLQNDSAITCQYNELLNRIKEQECQNFIFESEKNFMAAKRNVENGEYVFAHDILNTMLQKKENYLNCNYDYKKVDNLYKEIKDLYIYQNNRNRAIYAYQNSRFKEADSLIDASMELFRGNVAIQKKLSTYQKEDLFIHVYDTLILRELAYYYAGIDSLELSLKVIFIAYERKAKQGDYSVLLNVLGKRMAKLDYKKDKKYSATAVLSRYKTYNQWFKPFNKAYKWTFLKNKILFKK